MAIVSVGVLPSCHHVSKMKVLTWHKAESKSFLSSRSLVLKVNRQGRQQAALGTNSLR